MWEIIDKKIMAEGLGTRIIKLEISAPGISLRVLPGQFVVLMVSEKGERIPLTVVDKDREKGTLVLIFQELGLTTHLLGRLGKGERLYALLGPLGNPSEIKNYGKVVLVGGGVGIAEIFPVAKALKEKGNYLTLLLGARTKNLLILEEELRRIADEIYTATDDGSYGWKGLVTDILLQMREDKNYRWAEIDFVYAVGPIPMMKKVSEISRGIKTVVSLNALMVDATGMCGCCRVTIKGETKFSCVDGPEFSGQDVDWEELERRTKMYVDKERHICKLYNL